MTLILHNAQDILLLLIWIGLWALGGIWIARSAFNLRANEQALGGFAIGVILQIWIANFLDQIMHTPVAAFWLAAGSVFLLGLVFALTQKPFNPRELIKIPVYPLQLIILALLTYIFFIVGGGLAILDDYQNLPTLSLLATGDIPPHFALDPKVIFNYHYFSLLFAGELMRIAGLHVWNSLDIARGLGFALTLMLGALWVQRATNSTLAAFIAGLLGAFGGGTRWVLLLLPEALLKQISANVHMIGSASQSGPNLLTALTGAWAVETGSAWPIPFAYANGIQPPSIWLYHSGGGMIAGAVGTMLLLTFTRWRGWRGIAITVCLLASLGLGSETTLVKIGVGFVFIALVYAILHKSIRLPKKLLICCLMLIPVGLIAALQGGVLSGIISGLLGRVSGTTSASGGGSYFTWQFNLFWPPAFLSTHLGFLSLLNPYQLITLLLEIGPMILTLPLVVIWGLRAYRSERWYEAAIIVLPFLSLVTLVIQYTGNAGPTALARVQDMFVGITSSGFAIVALWWWASHRKETIKALTAAMLFLTMFGGIVLFGIELLAAPKPIYSTFITILDARVEHDFWNKLPADAVIFDSIAYRAPTILGRPNNSHLTWYEEKPEYSELVKSPSPRGMRAAGFTNFYVDLKYWDSLKPEIKARFNDPCVRLLKEYVWDGTPYDFRRLYDIRDCPAQPEGP